MDHMQEDGYVEIFFVSYEHVAHFDRLGMQPCASTRRPACNRATNP